MQFSEHIIATSIKHNTRYINQTEECTRSV